MDTNVSEASDVSSFWGKKTCCFTLTTEAAGASETLVPTYQAPEIAVIFIPIITGISNFTELQKRRKRKCQIEMLCNAAGLTGIVSDQ
jgi:hypothetical protein